MNTHLLDIIKVNAAAWSTLGLTHSGLIKMAEAAQALGTVALIFLTVGYTIYKWIVAVKKHEWDKEDRNGS